MNGQGEPGGGRGTPPLRILAVGAHAADMEFSCGMVLAKYARAGAHVSLLHLTAGERGHPRRSAEEYRRQKVEEAARAAAELGGHMRVLDYRDGELPRSDAVAFAVCDVIRAERPDVVITHWRRSLHKDHARCHRIVADALFYAALPAIERPLPHHAARAVYFTDNWEDQPGFEPNVFVEVEEADMEAWRRACAHYELFRGGISRFRYADYYAALATVRGCLAGLPGYAVAFHRPAASHAGRWLPL